MYVTFRRDCTRLGRSSLLWQNKLSDYWLQRHINMLVVELGFFYELKAFHLYVSPCRQPTQTIHSVKLKKAFEPLVTFGLGRVNVTMTYGCLPVDFPVSWVDLNYQTMCDDLNAWFHTARKTAEESA